MALDFNYDPAAEKRTLLGEAEYQAKYRGAEQELSVLGYALVDAIDDLPIPRSMLGNHCVSCVPSPPSTRTISRRLAGGVSKRRSVDFLNPTLRCPKPAMKQVSISDKIDVWEQLYDDDCVVLSRTVSDRLVIVVDDLYQSGITMWSYARFLKSQGASHVFGLPCVKSLRDSDNR